ncbi:hypothetical protein AAVH_28957 [Aphelenchoides avenae]|nr:hypothetical protein AAVH_31668 [Aphelenchus avenae]KAH7703868.1 hypothetical protein AAVH_28957 [Aphelenchus avenae]
MVPFHTVAVSAQVVMMSVSISSIQFALLPDGYTIHWTMRNLWNPVMVSSVQECVDLAVAEEPAALAIYYYSSTGTCRWSTGIYGYYPLAAGQEPHCYLRTDNVTNNLTESDCLTDQDAEYLIAKLSFGDEQCVDSTYDDVSGLCITKNYESRTWYGNYGAGRLRDGTQYLLTRDKAIESVTYECAEDEFNTKVEN